MARTGFCDGDQFKFYVQEEVRVISLHSTTSPVFQHAHRFEFFNYLEVY